MHPPGWPIVPQILLTRERWPGGSKVRCVPLVYIGQEVLPDQPVLRLEPAGFTVAPRSPGSFVPASKPEAVPAGLHGRVVETTARGGVVIESRAALIQGVVGAGKQVAGVLIIWQSRVPEQGPQMIPPGAILVVPGPLNFTLLRQAASSGVAGIVASSISLRDLEGFLHTDFVQLIDRDDVAQLQMQLPPITLLLTEGLGTAIMPASVINLLSRYQGSVALLSGVTSVHQQVYPELIISLPIEEAQQQWHPVLADPTLSLGAQVRVLAGEYAGSLGVIDYLFAYNQTFLSGVRARAASLRLEDGSLCVVPLALIQRIG